LLKKFIRWLSPTIMERFTHGFRTYTRYHTWCRRSMAPTYSLLHSDCILLIITTERISFNFLVGHDMQQIFVLEFWHKLNIIDAWCQHVEEDRHRTILWDIETFAICFGWRCYICVSLLDIGSVEAPQRRTITGGIPLKPRPKFNTHVYQVSNQNAKR